MKTIALAMNVSETESRNGRQDAWAEVMQTIYEVKTRLILYVVVIHAPGPITLVNLS